MGGGSSGGPRLHRRDLPATTGVAAAGLLAGCPGDSESGRDDTRTFVAEEANSPENVNYNRFDDTYFPGQSAELIFGPFYNSTAGQETDGDGVLPGLMKVEEGPWEDVSGTPSLVIEDDEFVLPMHEEFTWHDGDPVTARDVMTLLELERLRGADMWEPLESVEIVDDYSLRFETVPDVLEPLVVDRVITTNMSVKYDVFEQFLPEEPIEDLNQGQRTVRVQELGEFGPAEAVVREPTHPYTKALKWATPSLGETPSVELPVRSLDIPDPVDPPAGCRFHTRCPHAREACRESVPGDVPVAGADHVARCYRALPDHAYWDSDALSGVEDEGDPPESRR